MNLKQENGSKMKRAGGLRRRTGATRKTSGQKLTMSLTGLMKPVIWRKAGYTWITNGTT